MRSIGVVTVGRSDYSYYLPVLRKISADPYLKLHLIVAGMHFDPEFGNTVDNIKADGFEISDRVEFLIQTDSPEGVAKTMGAAVVGFSQSYARFQPDILLTLGDRFEMHAAVSAALPFNIPVAHMQGGESTEGAIDESLRHSITKMSHLHFPSTLFYGNRIIQMGEEPWRVRVSGSASLDNAHDLRPLTKKELQDQFGLRMDGPQLLVTYHPVTLESELADHQFKELLAALETVGYGVIFTYPNADTYGRELIDSIRNFASAHTNAQAVANLGTVGYFSLLQHVDAMVGNSSSGIIEAATFKCPVVNIGNRQQGRVHGINVIDTGYGRKGIASAIRQAVSPEFRKKLTGLTNIYGDGTASKQIVSRLKEVELGKSLLVKRFHDSTEIAEVL